MATPPAENEASLAVLTTTALRPRRVADVGGRRAAMDDTAWPCTLKRLVTLRRLAFPSSATAAPADASSNGHTLIQPLLSPQHNVPSGSTVNAVAYNAWRLNGTTAVGVTVSSWVDCRLPFGVVASSGFTSGTTGSGAALLLLLLLLLLLRLRQRQTST